MVRLDSIFPADLIPDELGDIYVMRSNPMEEDTDGDEIIDGRDFYKFLTPEAYEKMLNSISHQKVLKILEKSKL